MRARICKSFTFDAAHRLPSHKGKCKNLHGHTYTVEVEVLGEIERESGMVLDFAEISDAMSHIIDLWDHSYLNEKMEKVPTAENMAEEIFKWVSFLANPSKKVVVTRVRVYETPRCWAEVRREDNG